MRFHHSTRRGRTKFSQAAGPHQRAGNASHSSISNRWAQLSYCRQTNIHFNRRLAVEVPSGCGGQLPDWRLASDKSEAGQLERNMSELQLTGEERLCAPTRFEARESEQMLHLKADDASQVERDQVEKGVNLDTRAGKLDMEGARAHLVAQVEKHPFWSNKAARRMRLLELVERRIFIYELVSHCQRRDLEWRYEPYRGGLVAGTGPFQSGVRRVFSAVGERAPPVSPLRPTDLNNNNQSDHLRGTVSASEPTSPDCAAPQHQQSEPAEFPFGADSATVGHQHHHHLLMAPDEQSAKLRTRPAIRRSYSSAPNGSAAAAAAAAATAAGPAVSQSTFAGLTSGANCQWGEPRPLPCAELVWSIEPPAHLEPAPFASYIHTTEVPHSSFVKRCHGCQGRGRLKCTSCYGVGYEVCISCSGKGTLRALSSSGVSASSTSYRSANSHATDSTLGSMWNNADSGADSSRALGSSSSGRHEEPGGISGGSGSGGGGAWTTESCHFCHGAGQKRCWICAGRSYNTCTACAGTGQLRCFLNLNITWTNHRDECVLNNADAIIPRDRLKLSSGLLLADECARRLSPLTATSAPSVACSTNYDESTNPPEGASELVANTSADGAATCRIKPGANQKARRPPLQQMVRADELSQLQTFSARLLERHAANYGRSERLLRQRQRVTQIDCHLVHWEWKRRRGHFVIYGDEQKVYIAKYPFKSLCNIT